MRFLLLLLIAVLAACQGDAPDQWDFQLEYRLFHTQGRTQVWVALPQSIAGRQTVLERTYSLKPTRYLVRDGDSAAEFQLMGSRDTAILRIGGRIRLHALPAAPAQDQANLHALEQWSAARLRYQLHPAEDAYTQAYAQGYGDCSEFADLAAAACRFAGYAARRIEGISGPDSGQLAHAWTECVRDSVPVRLDPVLRQSHPDSATARGYLQIDNLSAWPREFDGQRWLAARSSRQGILRTELQATLRPATGR